MNQQLKQRIIGAIVLISLAIIFIPALLDGSHKNVSPLKERHTPQKPNFYFEEIKLPASVDAGKSPSRIIDSHEDLLSKNRKENSKKSGAKKMTTVASKPVKDVAKVVKSDANNRAPFAWTVQVASLTNSKRALKLRDRLKQQDFSAFVEEITKEGKKFYRVRVGPELKRKEAEALQQNIKKKMKLDGNVMRYRPL